MFVRNWLGVPCPLPPVPGPLLPLVPGPPATGAWSPPPLVPGRPLPEELCCFTRRLFQSRRGVGHAEPHCEFRRGVFGEELKTSLLNTDGLYKDRQNPLAPVQVRSIKYHQSPLPKGSHRDRRKKKAHHHQATLIQGKYHSIL